MNNEFDVKRFIIKNIGIILTIVISVLYIFKGFYSLEESGKTIYEILGDGALSALVGFATTALLRQTGINYGNDDIEVTKTRSAHAKKVDEISPYMNLLDDFCEAENKRVLRDMRTRILAPRGLKYGDYFDDDGFLVNEYIPEKKDLASKELRREYKKKIKLCKRALRRAQHLKLTPLNSASLTSEGARVNDPFDFGGSASEYTRERNRNQIFSKVLYGAIFGFYTLNFVIDATWQSLMWTALQVVLYLVFGAIELLDAYMFVKTDGKSSVLRKIDELEKFNAFVKEKKKDVNSEEI